MFASDNRQVLIDGLAESFGMGRVTENRYDEAKYDKETGTFYCNGHIITATTMDKAIIYFENMYQRAVQREESKEMAMIYELAAESIRLLKKNPNTVKKFIAEGRK